MSRPGFSPDPSDDAGMHASMMKDEERQGSSPYSLLDFMDTWRQFMIKNGNDTALLYPYMYRKLNMTPPELFKEGMLRGGFDEMNQKRKWSALGRNFCEDCALMTDLGTKLKQMWFSNYLDLEKAYLKGKIDLQQYFDNEPKDRSIFFKEYSAPVNRKKKSNAQEKITLPRKSESGSSVAGKKKKVGALIW